MKLRLILIIVNILLFRIGTAQVQFDSLICVNNQLNGDVLLTLHPPVNTCTGCTFVGYNIYYSTLKNGPYTLFGPSPTLNTLGATSFVHQNANGNANTYYYYVETICNCNGSMSYAYSDTLDNRDPVAPIINHVTVNGNAININWSPSSSPETYAYVIYYVDQMGNHIIDTIFGHNNTNYTDVNPSRNPNQSSFAYTIAAMDQCNTLGVFNLIPQNTILLKSTQDRCAQTVTLDWNAYKNWPSGVVAYKVYGSLNAGAPQHLASLNNNTFKFKLKVNDGENWCFEIHAIETGGIDSSTSNIICQTFSNVQAPNYNQIISCSTDPSQNSITIKWKSDPIADLSYFKILHKLSNETNFTLLQETKAIPGTLNAYSFTHSSINTKLTHNYLVIAIDSCNQAFYGSHCSNGVLEGFTSADNINHLKWTNVIIDSMLLDSMQIFRSIGAQTGVSIGTCAPLCDTFLDDISTFGSTKEDLCYTINYFYHSPQSPFNQVFSSKSNKWCGSPITEVFFPNSIFPKGNSNEFGPVITFPNFTDYSLIIYNRYGQIIFQTTNYQEHWNGKFKDEFVPAGDYTFILSYTKSNGKSYHQQGNVMAIY